MSCGRRPTTSRWCLASHPGGGGPVGSEVACRARGWPTRQTGGRAAYIGLIAVDAGHVGEPVQELGDGDALVRDDHGAERHRGEGGVDDVALSGLLDDGGRRTGSSVVNSSFLPTKRCASPKAAVMRRSSRASSSGAVVVASRARASASRASSSCSDKLRCGVHRTKKGHGVLELSRCGWGDTLGAACSCNQDEPGRRSQPSQEAAEIHDTSDGAHTRMTTPIGPCFRGEVGPDEYFRRRGRA